MRLYNHSSYDLELWGDKFADGPPDKENIARIIPATTGYYYFLADKLEAEAKRVIGSDGQQLVPFEAYLARAPDKKHFTAKFGLLIVSKNNVVTIHTQQFGVTADGW